ncbi:hypothetical protein IAQ61_001972, partial [Plenodomus lingam]|uniref:uncharacterized protein n=1 Tax=Leptosphaeria maculans TaxID=5022 RepID=UPI00332F20D2
MVPCAWGKGRILAVTVIQQMATLWLASLSKRMRIVALVMQRAINVVDKIHRMNYSAVRSVKKRADNVDRYLPLDLSGTPLLLQHDPLRTRQFKVNFSLYEFPQPLAVKYITPTLNAPIIAI